MKLEEMVGKMMTEAQFDEAAGEKDACYRKVKARYDVWPSAYASGALVKCRKVGAKNWGNKSKKEGLGDKISKNLSKYNKKNQKSRDAMKKYAKVKKLKLKGRGVYQDYDGMEGIEEDYKNSEWEVYVADENGKEKIVKKAKSKRAGVILYNKLINSDNYYEVGMRVVKESVDENILKQIQQAEKIAKSMAGNMTGAVKGIEKIRRGLSRHKRVKVALKKYNESVKEGLGDKFSKKLSKYNKKNQKSRDAMKKYAKLKKKESVDEARGTCWVGYQQKGMKDKGGKMVPNCVKEITEIYYEVDGKGYGYTFEHINDGKLNEAEYQGRKVKLGKPMQGDAKKFKVYVKNPKGNVVKVNFGQGGDAKGGTMKIRKSNPGARKSFRARHNCDSPGPRHKARYWSCRKW